MASLPSKSPAFLVLYDWGIYGISREEQDAFALRSHRLAADAWAISVYNPEIVQVPGAELVRDEGIRAETTLEKLGGLKALFAADGTVTAGNASPITDGASAVLLGAEGALDLEPLARVTGRGTFGNDPDVFGVARVEAANRALARAGRTWADVDFVELNEAFAFQSPRFRLAHPRRDPDDLDIAAMHLAREARTGRSQSAVFEQELGLERGALRIGPCEIRGNDG